MRVFIFHYHLNPGGVTRIIESQVAGFKQEYPDVELNVVAGFCENPEYYAKLNVKLHINAKLNYLVDADFSKQELDELHDEIYTYLKNTIKPGDILHVHNLNLGKNPILTMVFSKLNGEGYLLINHAHDFAEDRSVNMDYMQKIINGFFNMPLKEIMYPNNSRYLLGVLNSTDYNRTLELGVNKERLFLFPNPVYMAEDNTINKAVANRTIRKEFKIDDKKFIITYPVRVIRRKNIGELILLAVLFKKSCQFLVTMAPRNPIELEHYIAWQKFCADYEISILFEAGKEIDFMQLLSGSDYCITTSVQEGFGMTFLEPWLVGTPVLGRDLPYVTEDIKAEGVALNGLYKAFMVPFIDGEIDFKELSLEKQKQLIISILNKISMGQEIINLNNWLIQFPKKISTFEIAQNKKTITAKFSISNYAKRIFESYKTVLG